jgi:hypothetical protein
MSARSAPLGDQLDLEQALSERQAAQDKVLERVDWAWRDRVNQAISQLARKPVDFTADEVRAVAGEPPQGTHYNALGALIQHAARRGQIEPVGFTRSYRVCGHGNLVRLWRGAR